MLLHSKYRHCNNNDHHRRHFRGRILDLLLRKLQGSELQTCDYHYRSPGACFPRENVCKNVWNGARERKKHVFPSPWIRLCHRHHHHQQQQEQQQFYIKQVVKEFWRQATSQGRSFMGENLVWHTSSWAADKGIGAVAYVRADGPVRAVAF